MKDLLGISDEETTSASGAEAKSGKCADGTCKLPCCMNSIESGPLKYTYPEADPAKESAVPDEEEEQGGCCEEKDSCCTGGASPTKPRAVSKVKSEMIVSHSAVDLSPEATAPAPAGVRGLMGERARHPMMVSLAIP